MQLKLLITIFKFLITNYDYFFIEVRLYYKKMTLDGKLKKSYSKEKTS